MLIHEADALAVQFSVPCPVVLVMLKVCELEVTAPSIIMNEKGSGLSPIMGRGVGGGGWLLGGGGWLLGGGGWLLGGGGWLLGGGGWVLGAGITRFSNRSMK